MCSINKYVDMFWKWTGNSMSWKDLDIASTTLDPLCYPGYEEMKNICIASINKQLSDQEFDAFLLCMALDEEDECILDACKSFADIDFLCTLISKGVSFPQSGVRWQIAELLRMDIPNKNQYLTVLRSDTHPYVRKRAYNVAIE